jgi:hypothetical protein
MIRYLKDNPVPAFDPDTIQTLCGALDMAWQTVEIDKAAFKVDVTAMRLTRAKCSRNKLWS